MSESWLEQCERKHNQREARRNTTPRIKNWTEEYHQRQLAFFNTIPENSSISENNHRELFPYGPSIYRDTKKQSLQLYKKFIVYNKVNATYARATKIQEKLV